MTLRIVKGDLADARIVALLEYHVRKGAEVTEPGSAHALDVKGLAAPDVDFWAIWQDEKPMVLGALKRLAEEHGDDHGEVKSMHTAQEFRGRGGATVMLRHIIGTAQARGLKRLSLETGSMAYFDPAVALYRKHGFVECPPFATYRVDRNSLYLTLDLTVGPTYQPQPI